MKITANEGKCLTQVADVPTEDRVYCTELICPDGDGDKWKQVDVSEYEAWLEAQEENETAGGE